MDAFWVWLAQHPLAMAPIVGLLSGLVGALSMWLIFRKRPGTKHWVLTESGVQDLVRRHRHTEFDRLDTLAGDIGAVDHRLRQFETRADRVAQSHARSIQSLQRAVQALQRKAQAEDKPTRKPRGRKAQGPKDVWDHLLEDNLDGQAPREG